MPYLKTIYILFVFFSLQLSASEKNDIIRQQSYILKTNWQSIETDNFIIYYSADYDWEANQVLQNLEYYREDVIKLTGNNLGKIPIVIEDEGMYSNGFASFMENKIHIFTFEPGSNSTLSFDQNWYRLVGIHEYTHIGHGTNTKGMAKIPKFLFGNIFQPNLISPAWVFEGITVFSESQQSSYEGRLNDGYFNAVIASKAKEKTMPSIRAATNILPTYPFGDWYVNGGIFFNYLSNTYGKEKIPVFFNKYGEYWWAPIVGFPFPGLGIDLAAKKVYGKSMKNLYKEWTDFEEEKYLNWQVDGQKLTNSGWYKGYLKEYKNKIYYFKLYYNRIDIGFTQLIEFDPVEKKEKVIANLNNSISSPIQIQNGQIYYTVKEVDGGYSNVSNWGYTSILYSMDINTGKRKEIYTDDIRAFCIFNNGDILYSKDQKHHFGSELWKYSNGEKHKIGDTDQLISELEAGDAGVFVVSRTDFENWNVNQLNLENMTFNSIADSPWAEAGIHLQNNKLIYTTNYDKIYSVFAFDLANKTTYKLTNEGFSREGITIEDSLYFVGLSSHGEDIFVKPLHLRKWESPVWATYVTPDFSTLNLNLKTGGYSSNLKKLLRPYTRMFYPNLEDERIGLGLLGADILGQNTYAFGLEFSSAEKKYYINTSFDSKILSPLYISTYTNYSDSLKISIDFPLYVTSRPGLSSLWTGLSLTFSDENFEEKTLKPYVKIYYGYPLTSSGISILLPIQRTAWKSRDNEFGLNISSWVSQKTEFGYLGVNTKAEYSDTDSIIFSNRGKGELNSPLGVTITPSYTVQLIKFRRGFWNVNMFIEDFNGKLFVDYTQVKNGEILSAFGGEIGMETRVLFSFIRFSPTFGVAINKEGEWNYYWELQFQ